MEQNHDVSPSCSIMTKIKDLHQKLTSSNEILEELLCRGEKYLKQNEFNKSNESKKPTR